MTRWHRLAGLSFGMFVVALTSSATHVAARGAADPGWDPVAAGAYLDGRADWWTTWPNAARDRGTYCMSCHTTLPYALARPALRPLLGERAPSAAEGKILGNLTTRARQWREVEPWYPDQTRGVPKTSESRAIEAVMNAAVLARRDAASGALSAETTTALDVMWALQMKTGPETGAWTWLNFRLEPWESPNSPYFGASMAALAIAATPASYRATPAVAERVTALGGYFQKQHATVSLLNQLTAVWATRGVAGLLTDQQRTATVEAALARQHADGGWSTAEIGGYTRTDKTENDTSSDGYATGLATLALQAAGVPAADPRLAKGLTWLRTHQDKASGRWLAASPNKARDPESDAGKFLSDAATAYAVLSLTYQR